MPISYSVDHQKGLITETWTGDIAATDLAAYWRDYLADPDVLAIRRTLVDLRQCRILFTRGITSHETPSALRPGRRRASS